MLKNIMISILISVLVAQVLGKWDTPIKILPRTKDPSSIFTDNSNGISHIMTCNTQTAYFSYKKLYANGTVTPAITLHWDAPCTIEHKLDGPHDGKTLYLVFHGSRKRGKASLRCQDNPDGCEEVYFAESIDSGDHWTTPIATPRKDMNDRKMRRHANLLIGKEKRLWIFYATEFHIDAPCAYIMRTPGSSIFSLEVDLPINVTRTSVVYNEYQGSGIISLYYQNSERDKNYRYYTSNNGISWKGPEEFDYCGKRGENVHKYPFNSLDTPSVLVVGCKDIKSAFESVYWIARSVDAGKTWERINDCEELVYGKFNFAGDIFAYGAATVYYMKLKDRGFKEMGYPPTPENERCVTLTSSYKLKSYWFWYETLNRNSQNKTLWVTRGDMENAGNQYLL